MALCTAGLVVGGCEVPSFLDPTQLVDPKKSNKLQDDGSATPIVQVILDDLDLGVAPPEGQYPSARDVTAADLRVVTQDYIIGPTDQLRVSIGDFPFPNQRFVDAFEVSDTGLINLPDIGEVSVEGLTETQAAEAIADRLREEEFLVDPRVNVLAFTKQNRTYTIIGRAVAAAGRYPIAKPEFRLLDALAQARGVVDAELAAEYAFVIRSLETDTGQPAQPAQPPRNQGNQGGVRPGQDDPLRPQSDAGEAPAWDGAFEGEAYAMAQTGTQAGGAGGFEFEAPQEPTDRETIRVPLRELLNGAQRFNIVIRPGDTVIIPAEVGGFYYVGGNTNGGGVFNLVPGSEITLKRAILAARGLNQVAVPQRTQIVRKIGDQDVFIRVNLAKIFIGQEPDLYVQPDDMIMVGTNFPAPFLAALRNGFRVTYGFGFLYDRNFAREREGSF